MVLESVCLALLAHLVMVLHRMIMMLLEIVYMWGEFACDNSARAVADSNLNPLSARADVLLPKPLESNVVLDIHHVACRVRHAALFTRQ